MNTQQHIGRMRILIDALFLSILSVPSYLYAATLYDYIDLSAQGCTWANWPLYVSQPGSNSAVLNLPENYSKVYLSYPTIFSPLGGIIAVNNTLAYWAPTAAPSWPLCKNWIQIQGDTGVDWQITNSPSGSNPRWAGEMTVPEDTKVLYKKYFGLGSMPGEFKASASCSDCTEGSPQEFTATAECPDVPKYYQTAYNDRNLLLHRYDTWCKIVNDSGQVTGKATCPYDDDGNLPNGYVPYTIKEKGCALTSLAMVMGRYGSQAKPDEWNAFMTTSGGYTPEANVKWDSLPNIDEQLVYKYKNSNTSLTDLDAYLAKCIPVIVKVINPNTNSWHRVVVTGKAGDGYSINDPGFIAGITLSAYNNKVYAIRVYEDTGGCQ